MYYITALNRLDKHPDPAVIGGLQHHGHVDLTPTPVLANRLRSIGEHDAAAFAEAIMASIKLSGEVR